VAKSLGDPELPRVSARSALRFLRNRGSRPIAYNSAWEPVGEPEPVFTHPISQACTYGQISDPEYARWCERFHVPHLCHRKQWEWCYIAQALTDAGVVAPGSRGLGFGVGTEPLVAYLASQGVAVTATDLAASDFGAQRWAETGQHASAVAQLNADGLCPQDEFDALVAFRPVDMNAIPDDLRDFDFTWSSCAFEHLGDLDAGVAFFLQQIDCLRPGGVGVHTTEYNVSSNSKTVDRGHTVFYRRRDIEALVHEVAARGHAITATFALGDAPEDRHVDRGPWSNTHLKIQSEGYVITSFGLVVRKASAPVAS
jgi:SAM-dependent methyltransferase